MAAPTEPTPGFPACLALPRLHLWQGGQRLNGKPADPLNFTAGRLKAHSFDEEVPLAGLPEC